MIRIIVLLTIPVWILAHLFNEGDHCLLARSCQHNGVPVRGCGPDGRTQRSFLDACDLHEYNCDYGTDFKLDIEKSATSLGTTTEAADIPHTGPKRPQTLPTSTTVNVDEIVTPNGTAN